MKIWYYAVGQEHMGPISEGELRDLIKQGQATWETLLWRDGMSAWQPVSELPEFSAAFVTPPTLPLKPPPVQALPVVAVANVAIDAKRSLPLQSRPWPRFWARSIDTLLLGPVIIFGAAVAFIFHAPDLYLQMMAMNAGLLGIIVLPALGLLLAILMVLTGTTPGKAIVGVRVLVPEGRNRVAFFFSRELKVWAAEWGLGIPILNLYTQSRQYSLLAASQPAS
ncbi:MULTISPECIES: RDD family protein [unclassified Rhizobium]|uniref:RDD family protein n=1 Tax=unclassified Rhizobium TaxID=2613769 RepID=UPI00287F6414|nr:MULTISPECIES: RDD family protein [unclassified Rhizobium]